MVFCGYIPGSARHGKKQRIISVSGKLNASKTTAVLSWFLLATALHPEKQAKAQAEIDRVVGNERLPQLEDKESLPYTMAIMKEVLRWQPVAPMGKHLFHVCGRLN